ncbi:MAG TPA: hypothetical protein VME17_23210 [Bryobacteraceae bacterium]|nr:hypothetical protein [Bryobacteraceae bacterium]
MLHRITLAMLIAVTAYGQKPIISYRGIVNPASYMPPGLPAGGIAQGSQFSIFGKNIGPSSSPALAYPLQTTLGSVSVTITQGKTSVSAYPVFVSPGQVNAILPSDAPLGLSSVQITYNGFKSNLAPVKIVASSFGIFTSNSAGIGPAIIQNFVSASQQPINSLQGPAQHGETVILWGTGLGPAPFPDNIAPSAMSLSTPTEVFVGGVPAQIAYSGRTPCCSGIDEIIFTVPSAAPSGCWVPVQVRTQGTVVSNSGTIAISDKGPCSEPSNTLVQALLQGGSIASFVAARISVHEDVGVLAPGDVTTDLAGGYLAAEQTGPYNFNPMFSFPPAGACTTYNIIGWFPDDVSLLAGMLPTSRFLNAGTSTLSGPGGSVSLFTSADLGGLSFGYLGGALSAVPAVANSGFLNPGKYTLTATGASDIGPFQATATVPSPIVWTNRDQLATIDRSEPLTLDWTGASPGSTVFIVGAGTDLPSNSTAMFLCVAPAGASTFTVPPVMLSNLPASRSNVLQSPAALYLGEWSFGAPATFSASGLNFGLFTTAVIGGRAVVLQ